MGCVWSGVCFQLTKGHAVVRKDVNMMWTSHIRSYKEVFPCSAFLAEAFDFLPAVWIFFCRGSAGRRRCKFMAIPYF